MPNIVQTYYDWTWDKEETIELLSNLERLAIERRVSYSIRRTNAHLHPSRWGDWAVEIDYGDFKRTFNGNDRKDALRHAVRDLEEENA